MRRNKILREANRKEGSDTRHRIDPDLTREQKARLDELWEEARQKTAASKNGTTYFVIGKERPELRSKKTEEQESDSARGISAVDGSGRKKK